MIETMDKLFAVSRAAKEVLADIKASVSGSEIGIGPSAEALERALAALDGAGGAVSVEGITEMSVQRITAALESVGLVAPKIGEKNSDAIVKIADAFEKLVAVAKAAKILSDSDLKGGWSDLVEALEPLEIK